MAAALQASKPVCNIYAADQDTVSLCSQHQRELMPSRFRHGNELLSMHA